MILTDVNVLVYAHREDAREHRRYASWLADVLSSDSAFGVSDQVLCGFVRVTTHRRIFADPTPMDIALEFARELREHPASVLIEPGERHWAIFADLCRSAKATGNLITDAWLAALAIESGCEWITEDRDFARFRGLRWRSPFE